MIRRDCFHYMKKSCPYSSDCLIICDVCPHFEKEKQINEMDYSNPATPLVMGKATIGNKWETVRSWEYRNEKIWPQDAPVWYRTYKSCRWRFALRYEAQHVRKHDRGKKTELLEFIELIADDSGTPPADWREK